MSSFNSGTASISFTFDANGFSDGREARVAVQEIPGGDEFFVDMAGRSPQSISGTIVVANATAWGQLNALVGTQGTLAIDTLDSHEAVLMNVSRDAPLPDGQMTAN